MGAWTEDELRRIGETQELEIAAVRRNGELRSCTPICVVRGGGTRTRVASCELDGAPGFPRATSGNGRFPKRRRAGASSRRT